MPSLHSGKPLRLSGKKWYTMEAHHQTLLSWSIG